MTELGYKQSIFEILGDLRGLNPLKELFWGELNYDRVNESLSRHGWSKTATEALIEDPVLFASGGQGEDFHIIYSRLASDSLLLGHERPVVSRLLRNHPYALFVFSNESQDRWHFLNVKYDEETEKRRLFRRITIGPEERLRTATERLSLLDVESIDRDLFGIPPLAIQQAHDDAFDVEAVTKQFFDEYKSLFDSFQTDLTRQSNDKIWAHDYALQFLNRIMFLYFVQRKGWIDNDSDFIGSFWRSYKGANQRKNSFSKHWLSVLFFEAFNNKFVRNNNSLPEGITDILSKAPYLNGGLFQKNDLDNKHTATITDSRFEQILMFLERYNFTISEDSPFDKEVAVDPEMIGKVYESLVNVSIEASERRDAGIFYTPRIEIDLMCRLALVDNLANHLGQEFKSILYEAVFAFEADEKRSADEALRKANLWGKLYDILREIKVIDPACGSGSFLVGMLYVLDDLQARAAQQLKISESAYDRKKRIIGDNIYGVDVMDWACHIAELRLWLALIIDADLTTKDLHFRKEPLLPHFTFKIRCGNSLIQEVGGVNLAYSRASYYLPPGVKDRINHLKTEKCKFYNNDSSCQFSSPQDAINVELRLFKDILDARVSSIQKEIIGLKRKIEGETPRQIRLDGTIESKSHQMKLEDITFQKQIEVLNADLKRINSIRSTLKTVKDVPFVWDIAFVEIFEGQTTGFDIVIGNPPYVRQENISDPLSPRKKAISINNKTYKAKLARSVYLAFPHFFEYNTARDIASKKMDAKSDLYVYFYFHGLSLLNPKGSFCFITSNSWLDVGYGTRFQEFLLNHCHIRMIIDNQTKRSFKSADVNTVIVILSAPKIAQNSALENVARFIMFKEPFEHILSPVIFQEIETAMKRKSAPEYRVHPIQQKALFVDGCVKAIHRDNSDNSKKHKTSVLSAGLLIDEGQYIGDKWGGKYLRAPDIFWTILEKEKLIPIEPLLGKVSTVSWSRQGRNAEIMVNTESLGEKTIPVLKSPREFDSIIVKSNNAKTYLRVGLVKSNQIVRTPLIWDDIRGKRHVCRLNEDMMGFTHNFHGISLHNLDWTWQICAILNSTLTWFFVETLGRRGLGGGAVRILVEDLKRTPLLIHPESFSPKQLLALKDSFRRITARPVQDADIEITKKPNGELKIRDDRRALDDIIFDVLGLTQDERNALYEAFIDLIKSRLLKADSLK